MAPRGLSAEEKRVKLLEIFHETRDFYQLKELEKLGPKLKGIVSQSVKDVLQSLVDDGLVQGDKIGSSNFFWSFPSQHGVLVQTKLEAVEGIGKAHRAQIAEVKSAVEQAKGERIESDVRSNKLKKLSGLKKELCILEAELTAYGDSNPAKVEELKRAAFLAKEAVFRWTGNHHLVHHLRRRSNVKTDNYSMLLGHFTRQSGVSVEDIRQYLEIGEDYEDIE
ncbi:hypothetical protein M413DRAFT_172253 [Hebeloma cylindrosporum]|uniref:Meiotic nuclear division protein 1 n=1 Tax=Hebeloma cylindrosporum TaxID=76867 RepID=A0A0C3BU15_HEBCY|nr:hypothetical protein M413DRAFT_172253 [Hebeloma cylindrosporum h7]